METTNKEVVKYYTRLISLVRDIEAKWFKTSWNQWYINFGENEDGSLYAYRDINPAPTSVQMAQEGYPDMGICANKTQVIERLKWVRDQY